MVHGPRGHRGQHGTPLRLPLSVVCRLTTGVEHAPVRRRHAMGPPVRVVISAAHRGKVSFGAFKASDTEGSDIMSARLCNPNYISINPSSESTSGVFYSSIYYLFMNVICPFFHI